MKLSRILLVLSACIIFLSSCDRIFNTDKGLLQSADSTNVAVDFADSLKQDIMNLPFNGVSSQNFVYSSANSINIEEGMHKFIRKAQLKYKVKDVVNAAYQIEDIVIKTRGFIIKSDIKKLESETSVVNLSEDSSLVTQQINLAADMELRVPAATLDSTLKALAPLAVVVDYRRVETKDVTLQLLTEKLALQNPETASRPGNAANAAKVNNGTLNQLSSEDKSKLAAFSMSNQIAYSTINISLYQDPFREQRIVTRDIAPKDYDSGFGQQLSKGVKKGWSMLNTVLVFITNIWPFVLIAILIYYFYSRHKRKKKERAEEEEFVKKKL